MSPLDLAGILKELASATGVDFSDYRPATIERGVAERLTALGLTAGGYLERLQQCDDEVPRLARTLLVSHTSFFRDPAVFSTLGTAVVHHLVRRGEPVRAWAVGVATGEEAWTLALTLADTVGAARSDILATDLDTSSLERARTGAYARTTLRQIPEAMRQKWLSPREGDHSVFHDELQACVRFVRHDFVGTRLCPPEAIVPTFRLVLCRNVLIWFSERLRREATARLRAVVAPGGALVVGTAETVAADSGFEPWPGVQPEYRIYRRMEETRGANP